ncbi:hypothetical protein [Pseudonocardia alni]|uniref:hypothetical protein n=1 Tax=Pseudonocardia alni TaxID=33907 RepID=UPI0033C93A03
MATPPRVTDAERDAAVTRIVDRHDRIDDPRRSELGSDPRDVVTFVLNRGPAGVPRWVQAADHHDAVVLSSWCWWEERRRERRLLRQGSTLGLSATELGAPLGIRSRQGVRDRLDRLDALLTNDRPDEQLGREARRGARQRDAGQNWLDQHLSEVRPILLALIGQARWLLDEAEGAEPTTPDGNHADAESDDIRDWADELAADYQDEVLTPATLALAGLLAAELRAHPSTVDMDHRHRLRTTLAQVESLRASLAAAR